ncbi:MULTISPECIES: type VI secretion system lipoprotein TssJ [unclassified Pseudomonas]|uniref:type VI secretion system lipoprotein TssJ n=1 Tax=unclassified Pseudomonas TaxID=196821 RepID=UPI000A1EE87C|nr:MULTISPECIES: type VI secretion system lipoprotein TssJ [unclassified Pseudomonas]
MNKRIGLALACLALSGCTSISKAYQLIKDPTLPVGGPNNDISHVGLSLYAADPPVVARSAHATLEEPAPPPDQSARLAVTLSATDAVGLTDKMGALAEQLHQNYLASPSAPAQLASYTAAQSETPEPASQAQRQAPSSIAFKVLQLRDDSLLLDATYEQLEEDLDKALGSTLISVDDFRLMPGHFKFIEHEEINERTRYIAVVASLDDPQGKWKDSIRIKPRGYSHTVHVHFENNGVELRQDSELLRNP